MFFDDVEDFEIVIHILRFLKNLVRYFVFKVVFSLSCYRNFENIPFLFSNFRISKRCIFVSRFRIFHMFYSYWCETFNIELNETKRCSKLCNKSDQQQTFNTIRFQQILNYYDDSFGQVASLIEHSA